MFKFFTSKRAATKAKGPLADVYNKPRKGWLAVDVETTGLDPAKDQLLSIGWVAVDEVPSENSGSKPGEKKLEINLGVSGYVVIRAEGDVGQSATVHGLTDDMVAQGVSPEEGVAKLLEDLAGRTLLAHYAQMELGFLSPVCKQHFVAGLEIPVADTMVREYEKITATGREPRREELRLWALCQAYGLPTSKAHHAFNDALSCAQLWLAQHEWGTLRRPDV